MTQLVVGLTLKQLADLTVKYLGRFGMTNEVTRKIKKAGTIKHNSSSGTRCRKDSIDKLLSTRDEFTKEEKICSKA